MNYFDLFKIAPQFTLDLAALTSRYRELQRECHPDRVAAQDHTKQAEALHYSSMVNDAFETLKHPLRRAIYLLELHGVVLNSEQRTFQDPAFLMAQMELREQLEEIAADRDEQQLELFAEQIQGDISAYLTRLAASFDQPQIDDLEAVADDIRRLKFFYKLQDEIEQLEDSLLD